MPRGKGEGDAPTAGVAAATDAMRAQLEITNQLAAATDARLTAEQKTLQLSQQTAQVAQNALNTANLSLQALQDKRDALEQMASDQGGLTEAQGAELDLVRETMGAYDQGLGALQQYRDLLAQNAKQKQNNAAAAKEELSLSNEVANSLASKAANLFGIQKAQDGIIKKFMKSKNKAQMLVQTMKALAKTFTLGNIGMSIMRSGFQLLGAGLSKMFGSGPGGGGGGGWNLHQFVKETGNVGPQILSVAKKAGKLGKKLGIGADEGAMAYANLRTHLSGTGNELDKNSKKLMKFAVKMKGFGVDAEMTAKIFNSMQHTSLNAVKDTKDGMLKLFNTAKAAGVPVKKMMEGTVAYMEKTGEVGKRAINQFSKLTMQAKSLGVEVDKLAGVADNFLDWEKTVGMAAEANQMLGKTAFDAGKLAAAAYKSPQAAAMEMQKQLAEAGISAKEWAEMDYGKKKGLAESLNMDPAMMGKMISGGKKGLSQSQKAVKQVNNITGAVKSFSDALKKIKPPGGGGGGKTWMGVFMESFWKSYNKITGNKFGQNIKDSKKWLEEMLVAAGDWAAEKFAWFEEKVIYWSKKVLAVFRPITDFIGSLFGIEEAGMKLETFIGNLKGWGPVIVPLAMIFGGAMLKGIGMFGTLIGGATKALYGFGKAGVTAIANFDLKKMKAAWGSGGGMMDKLKNLGRTLSGKEPINYKSILAKERAMSKPVIVANQLNEPIPVTMAGAEETLAGGAGAAAAYKGVGGLSKRAQAVLQSRGTTAARGGFFGKLFGKKGAYQGTMRGGGGRLKALGNVGKSAFRMMRTGVRGFMVKGELAKHAAKVATETATKTGQVAAKSGMLGKFAGPALKGIGKIAGPAAGIFSAFTGVSKLIDGDVTNGLLDLAEGALMFMGPIGMAAGGALMLGRWLMDDAPKVFTTWEDIADTLSPKTQALMTEYDTLAGRTATLQSALEAWETKVRNKTKGTAREASTKLRKVEAAGTSAAKVGVGGQAAEARKSLMAQTDADYFQSSAWKLANKKKHMDRHEHGWKYVQRLQKDAFGKLSTQYFAMTEDLVKEGKSILDPEQAKKMNAEIVTARKKAEKIANDQAKSWHQQAKWRYMIGRNYEGTGDDDEANRKNVEKGFDMVAKGWDATAKQEAEIIVRQRYIIEAKARQQTKIRNLTDKQLGLEEKAWTDEAEAHFQALKRAKAGGEGSKAHFDKLGGDMRYSHLVVMKYAESVAGVLGPVIVDEANKGLIKFKKLKKNLTKGGMQFSKDLDVRTRQYEALLSTGAGKLSPAQLVQGGGKGSLVQGTDVKALTAEGGRKFMTRGKYRDPITGKEIVDPEVAGRKALARAMAEKHDKQVGPAFRLLDKVTQDAIELSNQQIVDAKIATDLTKSFSQQEGFSIDDKSKSWDTMKNAFFGPDGLVENEKLLTGRIADGLKISPDEATKIFAKLRKIIMGKYADMPDKYKHKGFGQMVVMAAQDLGVHMDMAADLTGRAIGGADKAAAKTKAALARTTEQKADALAQKGMKVSKKDLVNIDVYIQMIRELAGVVTETDIATKMAPIAVQIEKINSKMDPKNAAVFEGFATFLYNLKKFKGVPAGFDKLAVKLESFHDKVGPVKLKATADAFGALIAPPAAGSKAKALPALVSAAVKDWDKLTKSIDKFKKTADGKLFFKGGKITHKVDSKSTATFSLGAKPFGKAVIHGLKAAGFTNVTVLKKS